MNPIIARAEILNGAVFKLHPYFKKFKQGYSVKIKKEDVGDYVKNYYRSLFLAKIGLLF